MRRQGQCLSVACMLLVAPALFGDWRLAGPYGGSARSIAIDPQHHTTLLAGSRDSLLFRSDNAGTSWDLLPFPRGAPGVFNSVLIDPTGSGHFYAGLDAGDSPDSGLYESMDGGRQWRVLPDLRGFRIESLAMWPRNAKVLAAGTAKGIFLSSDAGEHWQRISRDNDPEMQDITALAFDPADAKTIYAGTPHLPWKTVDAGATWHSIHSGLIDDSDIFSIRVDTQHPNLLFASACSGIYRSDDSGEAWSKIQGIPGTHRRTHIIAQHPGDPATIFAGTTLGLLKSPDGGHTWRHLNDEQVNWMVFDPSDSHTLYLATEYAGILKSTDSGESFQAVNTGFVSHNLIQITGAGKRLYASTAYEGLYGGVFASEDGGVEWSLLANQPALHGRNLNSLVAVPSRAGLLFAASDDAVLKSTDGGHTWSVLLSRPRPTPASRSNQSIERTHIYSLKAAQTGQLVLLAATKSGLFRSLNGAATWQPVNSAGLDGVPILALYAPAYNPNGRFAARTASSLFLSDDAGRSWRLTRLPDPNDYVYDIAFSPDGDDSILAGTSRGLLQFSPDGSWRHITSGVPAATVDSVRFDPEHNHQAFLAQFGRIYRSLDDGNSWTRFPSEGLENSSIRTLWLAPDLPGRIFALTGFRGALIFDLSQANVARQADHAVDAKN